jgi:hypothetical protein
VYRRQKAWACLTAGAHIDFFHFPMYQQSVLDSADVADGMRFVGYTRKFLADLGVNLVGMRPSDGLVSAGWCYARSGDEYVVYLIAGGSVTVSSLPASTTARWFNPRTGTNQAASGGPTFAAPDGNDWVLHVVGASAAPVVTIAATDGGAAEPGANKGTLTVTRTGSTASALLVGFSVSGTAASGADYAPLGTSVTIPAGSASAALTVSPVDDAGAESAETVTVTLSAGASYAVGSPSSGTVTIYDDDAPAGTGRGLTGEYYDNADFTALALVRTDGPVDFDWGTGSPDPSIGADTFSVRWTGQVQALYGETTTFYTVSDDGVRLWVNGQLLVDNWTDHAPTENMGTIALVAGQRYDLVLEVYENGGGAVARLLWSSPSLPKAAIPAAQLFVHDTDGDGMADAAEAARGLDPADGDQDRNGTPDGADDWDGDGTDNGTELAQGSAPGAPPVRGASGGSDGGRCGATGAEGLLALLILALLGPARRAR